LTHERKAALLASLSRYHPGSKGCTQSAEAGEVSSVKVPVKVPVKTIEMAAALDIDRRTVKRQLRSHEQAGAVRRVGPDKGGHWEAPDG